MTIRLAALLPISIIWCGCPSSGKDGSDGCDTADYECGDGDSGVDEGAQDNDYDGFSADEDCDDAEPTANPSVAETDYPFDGIDNDCDDEVDEDLSLADVHARIYGQKNEDAGSALATAADVDADGIDDLLIGAEGNTDGGTGAGAAYLVLGPLTAGSVYDLAVDVEAKLVGAAYDKLAVSYLGSRPLLGPGDLTNDGTPDLVIGAYYNSEGASYAGAVYVLPGGSALNPKAGARAG